MNLLVAAGPQVLDASWARRLKVARRDIGEGMTMVEVDQLCETQWVAGWMTSDGINCGVVA